jgi:hypothetical protein
MRIWNLPESSNFQLLIFVHNYEGRLQSSWTHLITPSRNFVEVRWRSLFRSTSLGKRYTSYNAPPTSRKRAADCWCFMVGKAQKSHETRSELNSVFGLEKVDQWNPIRTSATQSRSRPVRFLSFSNHENGSPRQEISKCSTVCSTFSRSGWSVVKVHRLPREVLRKRDRHRTSTKFRFEVIMWVHELCKRPSYILTKLNLPYFIAVWRLSRLWIENMASR